MRGDRERLGLSGGQISADSTDRIRRMWLELEPASDLDRTESSPSSASSIPSRLLAFPISSLPAQPATGAKKIQSPPISHTRLGRRRKFDLRTTAVEAASDGENLERVRKMETKSTETKKKGANFFLKYPLNFN